MTVTPLSTHPVFVLPSVIVENQRIDESVCFSHKSSNVFSSFSLTPTPCNLIISDSTIGVNMLRLTCVKQRNHNNCICADQSFVETDNLTDGGDDDKE
jgi:hypothetical protein